jgi:hypothetical protein
VTDQFDGLSVNSICLAILRYAICFVVIKKEKEKASFATHVAPAPFPIRV